MRMKLPLVCAVATALCLSAIAPQIARAADRVVGDDARYSVGKIKWLKYYGTANAPGPAGTMLVRLEDNPGHGTVTTAPDCGGGVLFATTETVFNSLLMSAYLAGKKVKIFGTLGCQWPGERIAYVEIPGE